MPTARLRLRPRGLYSYGMALPYRSPFDRPIVRISARPDEPDAVTALRPRGSRRPHTDAKVAQVRALIEDTPLTYGEIARKTGVGRASICRWTRDHGWKRHPFAPRPTDHVPRARASAQLKRRMLAARLDALAERHIRELEEAACVDPDKLAEALELLKMAKLAARPRRGALKRGLEKADFSTITGEPMRPVGELIAAGIGLHRAPRAAVDDFLEHRAPPKEKPRRLTMREERERWMRERE